MPPLAATLTLHDGDNEPRCQVWCNDPTNPKIELLGAFGALTLGVHMAGEADPEIEVWYGDDHVATLALGRDGATGKPALCMLAPPQHASGATTESVNPNRKGPDQCQRQT